MKTFNFFGKEIPYLKQDGDDKIYGDRNIEIPLTELYIKQFPLTTHFTEIGAVLPYWSNMQINSTIYDPYDPHPDCVHLDCEKVDLMGQNVICISTLEHIGKEEYGNTEIDPKKAIRCFKKIIKDSLTFFITIPVGYHKELDDYLLNLKWFTTFRTPMFMYEQYDIDQWRQTTPSYHHKFNDPFPFANAIAFFTNIISIRG